MGWTPEQFWRGATVPEFWAAVDWITEKNLEIEEQQEEAEDAARQKSPPAPKTAGRAAHKAGPVPTKPVSERVTINPDLRVKPNPEFAAWRERLWLEHGI